MASRLHCKIKRMGLRCIPVHMLESSYVSRDLHCRPAVKMQCGASLKWATEENQRVLMFCTLREGNNDQQRDNNEFHRVMECRRRPPSLSLCLYLQQRILAVFLRVGQTKRLGHFFWRSLGVIYFPGSFLHQGCETFLRLKSIIAICVASREI